MRKMNLTPIYACMLASALMLGGCGQNNAKETAVSESVSQESVSESASDESVSDENASGESASGENASDENASGESASDENASGESSSDENASNESVSGESSSDENGSAADTAEKTADGETAKADETAKANESAQTGNSAQTNAKSINDIYGEISSQVSLISPVTMQDNFISNYYGIDTGSLEEYVFSMSEDATSAETIVIMKAKDAASVDSLKSALQIVIDEKKAEMENYLPEQFQIVEKSSVKTNGNYVYLVISEQADAISSIIEAGIQ